MKSKGLSVCERDPAYLLGIVESARRVEQFTDGIDRDAFIMDDLRISATTLNLIRAGEAATRVSAELKAAHVEIAWRALADLRHMVSYRTVTPGAVWSAATGLIPEIVRRMEPLVPPAEE